MNLQQMMMQAQKMQRELKKANDALANEEFTITKGGAVMVKMLGNKKVLEVNIDKDTLSEDNKEMLEELIMMAINELIEEISQKETEIQERITGRAGPLF